jgi:DNA-directed RNA polymerase specialized sigma24 family protein
MRIHGVTEPPQTDHAAPGTPRSMLRAMYASPDEVRLAIDGLTDIDYQRMRRWARPRLAGTSYASAQDLVVDVLGIAFDAASHGRGRRWRRSVEFRTYVYMTMRGVASDARRGEARRRVRFRNEPVDAAGPAQCTPSVEQQLVEKEEEKHREALYTEQMERALSFFREKDDKEVLWVIKGIMEDIPAQQIRERSGMTQAEYDAAHKRWRRGLDQLFPDRRSRK